MLNNVAFALTIFLSILATLITALKLQYSQAGKRLLILSRFNWQRFILIGLGIAIITWSIYYRNAILIYSFGAFALNFCLAFFLPTALCEQGILVSGFFIRWKHIHSYQWQVKNSKYLLLKFKSGSWNKRWKIHVNSAKQQQVNQILQTKIGRW